MKCLNFILLLVSLITIQTEEGNSEKLPWLLTLPTYESCMETSVLSIPVLLTKKQSLSITVSTQPAKAGISSPVAATEVQQEGWLQLRAGFAYSKHLSSVPSNINMEQGQLSWLCIQPGWVQKGFISSGSIMQWLNVSGDARL